MDLPSRLCSATTYTVLCVTVVSDSLQFLPLAPLGCLHPPASLQPVKVKGLQLCPSKPALSSTPKVFKTKFVICTAS